MQSQRSFVKSRRDGIVVIREVLMTMRLDFMFQLSQPGKDEVVENCDHLTK